MTGSVLRLALMPLMQWTSYINKGMFTISWTLSLPKLKYCTSWFELERPKTSHALELGRSETADRATE